MTSDRGVSDLVGYVLVFSIMILMIGTVYLVGVVQLHEITDERTVENTEESFVSLARNVGDLVRERAPERTTRIDLGGGSLSYGTPVELNLTVLDTGDWYRAKVRPIVYRGPDGGQVVYVNGMVLRDSARGGAVVVRPPPMVLGDRATVPYIRTQRAGDSSSGDVGVGGEGTVAVQTRRTSGQVFARYTSQDDYRVRLNVTSPRAPAWRNYLSGEGATCTTSGNTTACTFETGSLRVPLVRIGVRFAT